MGKMMDAVVVVLALVGLTRGEIKGGAMVEVESENKPYVPAPSSAYKNQYCVTSGKMCEKGKLLHSKFAPTVLQCMARCHRQEGCADVRFTDKKICELRDANCSPDELVPGPGTNFYRLKKGESCKDRPLYVKPPNKYSKRFCVMLEKRCTGHNLYFVGLNLKKGNDGIGEVVVKCLLKCAAIRTCSSVDFINGLCYPKSYHCPDNELVDGKPGDMNFMRLEHTAAGCPANRGPPPKEDSAPKPETPEPEPETPEPEPETPKPEPETPEPEPEVPEPEPETPKPEPETPEPEPETPKPEPETPEPEPETPKPEPETPEPEPETPEPEPETPEPEPQPETEAPKPEPEPERPTVSPPVTAAPACTQGPPAVLPSTQVIGCLCPCNSAKNGNGVCQCNHGFESVNGQCVIGCPPGSSRSLENRQACVCDDFLEKVGNECLPPCPKSTRRKGRGCSLDNEVQ